MDKTRRPPDRNRKAGPPPAKSPAPKATAQKPPQPGQPTPKASGKPSPASRPSAAPPLFRRASGDVALIYGTHAVRAAIAAKRRQILAVFATAPALERLAADFSAAGLTPQLVTNEDLARRLGANAVHQGIMIEARPLEPIDLSDIVSHSGIVLALDQITDPHNVGAILRTAAAFGVDALVTTERYSPELSGVMAKAASGALDYVPIALVGNFARALDRLGDLGYLRVGLDSQAPIAFEAAPLSRPLVLVLGGEGKGLRRLSREKCDLLVHLDMPGPIKSLNVSNACAVALALTRVRLGAL